MINSVGGQSSNHPLSTSRAERSEKLEQALNDLKVKIPQLSSSEIAASRQYGMRMVDDISSARFLQAPDGGSGSDFEVLAARLNGA